MAGPTYNKQLQDIVKDYRAVVSEAPTPAREMAQWAIGTGRWQPHPDYIVSKCAEELARAMSEEYYTDPQGRVIRTKHAARFQQTYLWDDMRTADRQFMAIAFQQRRRQIVGDCLQLKKDVDSYNENSNPGTPLQLVLDFRFDVAELEAIQTSAA